MIEHFETKQGTFLNSFTIDSGTKNLKKTKEVVDLFFEYLEKKFPKPTPDYNLRVKSLKTGEFVAVGFIELPGYYSKVNFHPGRKGFQETYQVPLKTVLEESFKESFKALERLFEHDEQPHGIISHQKLVKQ